MLGAVLVSLRPRQWVKNLFVFAGLVFGQRLFTPAVWPALGAFAIFCGLSGAVYLVNVDAPTVAVGFVLRALAGTLAIDVAISGWLLICTILLALFLALGKRRHEYLALGAEAARHRPILAEYNAGLLDQMIAVVTASTVTAYALYTMSPETVAKFHTQLLPATLRLVLYGI